MSPRVKLGFDPKEVASVLRSGSDYLYRDEDGELVASLFLGTVFGLTPSGKYYLPFACSNVEPCPRCNGSGEVPNPKSNPTVYAVLDSAATEIHRMRLMMYVDEGMREDECDRQAASDLYCAINKAKETVKKTITCPKCDGVGSYEAYLDELWQAKADAAGERHGFWIENGEGDPCDIFAKMHLDKVPDGKILNEDMASTSYDYEE